jgi:outer membrane protein assembly factor BamA
MYTNLKHRWNYAGIAGRIPYLSAFQAQGFDQQTGAYVVDQYLQRIYLDQLGGILQYPLSTTQRIEMGLTGTRQSYRVDVYRYFLNGVGQVIGQDRIKAQNCTTAADQLNSLCVPKPLYYTQGQLGFVGDYSTFGFTSPIAGARYRFEGDPTFGQIQMTTAIADYRRYFLARPITFAFRALHYGRYGRDAQNDTILYPIYLGNPQFVRGYDYNSIDPSECGNSTNSTSCPVFDRLLGSRIAVASAEIRIPLLGVEGLGLIRTNIVPVEIAPFVDAGIAWCGRVDPNSQSCREGSTSTDFRFVTGDEARATTNRIPVISTGISARINLFGYAVLETYYAIPFQRPDKRGGVFGFQLAPGW